MNVQGVLRHNVPNKGLLAPQKRLSSYGKRRDHFRHAFCLFYCFTNTAPNGLFFFFAILLFSIFPGLSCPAKLAGDIAQLSASCGRCSETE